MNQLDLVSLLRDNIFTHYFSYMLALYILRLHTTLVHTHTHSPEGVKSSSITLQTSGFHVSAIPPTPDMEPGMFNR